ncbi:sporulation transcriptional regulator SpoIIID [Ruminiclostridium herbifermentans]|nr:sporulation transcriptional regulator SpoIIID [Ruminiclostridium herbifermentans]
MSLHFDTTVHKDVTERLEKINPSLLSAVRVVLELGLPVFLSLRYYM